MKTKRWFFVLGAVVLLALLGKGADFYMRHREATLIERANTYWAAVASHDLLTAYHLEAEAASGNLRPDEVDQTRDWNVRIVSFSLGEITYYGHSAEILLSREMTWAWSPASNNASAWFRGLLICVLNGRRAR